MARFLGEDHLLELDEGRTIGYATWGDPEGTPVFFVHFMPGSRRDRYPGLDDPEWLGQQHLLFIGVDRPGYGYSDPWPEAGLFDCAGDIVRVADHLGLDRFAALGGSGGGSYALALGALAPERVGRMAIVSGMFEVDVESPEELAAELGPEARALREDTEGSLPEFFAGFPEVDLRMLEQADVRALCIEMLQESVRQGATGWIEDNLRLVRPWPFRREEIEIEVQFHHGEADLLAPPYRIAEGLSGSRLRLYPGEGHLSIGNHIKGIVETLLTT